MTSRDLKIAVIITSVCLLFSFGASYSYVHGWYLTKGVLPLALTVILVLISTIILEALGGHSKVALASTTGTLNPSPLRRRSESLSLVLRRTEALLFPLLLLIVPIIELIFSMSERAKKKQSEEMLRLFGRAHG